MHSIEYNPLTWILLKFLAFARVFIGDDIEMIIKSLYLLRKDNKLFGMISV